MNIEISKERMLEMAKKLASMDFCPEQRVFYKNILRMVKADVEGRLLVLPRKVGDVVYEILEETAPLFLYQRAQGAGCIGKGCQVC